MKKRVVIAALVVSLIGGGVVGTTHTFAQSNEMQPDTLIQKIADKFKLNKADVQAVFDEHKTEREKEMQVKIEERLQQAVTDGKITEDQKTLILNKLKELAANRQTEMESMMNKTPEERKAAMDKKRSEIETWAKENGIDMSYLMGMKGKGMRGHGFGHGMKMKMEQNQQ